MKVGILAGGLGTRLQEETTVKPKPMVEIGGQPILWHIMKQYGAYGFNEFAIALGYKGEVVKQLNGSLPPGARVQIGPRYSVNSQLRRFSPRDPGQALDGIGQYAYPGRFSTPSAPPGVRESG